MYKDIILYCNKLIHVYGYVEVSLEEKDSHQLQFNKLSVLGTKFLNLG